MALLDWQAKFEAHNNLVLIHTRGEEVQDWIEDYVPAKRHGTAFVIEKEYRGLVEEELTKAGFKIAR